MLHVVILAGGAGTRLWPASVRKRPKQFLDIGDGKSLLEKTVRRAAALGPASIIVVTHAEQAAAAISDLAPLASEVAPIVVLPEPEAKNTAPAIALAAHYLSVVASADDACLVLPADHVISPDDAFVRDVRRAQTLAADGMLVTFGIKPHRPETGYGYIETGTSHGEGWLVSSFREKPNHETALHYLKSGNYFWNSGMFVFGISTVLDELKKNSPDLAAAFSQAPTTAPAPGAATTGGTALVWANGELSALYAKLPSISFDYAVMEKSTARAMVKASFHWNDVGSWDEIAALAGQTHAAAISSGAITVEAERCYVNSDLPVAVCGLDDVYVIVKNGMVLVCKKGSSQLVKGVVDQIRAEKRDNLL